jgi:hypothetical protein
MANCDLCGKPLAAKTARRLAIPEYRAMIGFWPWVEIAVCPDCLEVHDRDFLERLRLLAPDVLENDEPVVGEVCLACGSVEPASPAGGPEGSWAAASKWVDAAGKPTRRAAFRLCPKHAGQVYIDGILVGSNLVNAAAFGEVLGELPTVGADLLARVEGWRPGTGTGQAGAEDFAADRPTDGALAAALAFWEASPPGLRAKAAHLGPVRKDYRLRYRLDLVRDDAAGRRETFTVVRTAPDRFATYRTAG